MSAGSNKSSSRIVELDVLRGVAALVVLVGHFTGLYDHVHGVKDRLGFDFVSGGYAVFLFFVISGYVILMTLERCATGADFLVSRFSRIFPAYWGGLLITFSLLHFLKPSPPGVLEFMVNFTMLERFLGLEHLDQVYWTLNVELSFYFWMFLIFTCRQMNRLNGIIALVLLFQAAISSYQTMRGMRFSQGVQAVFLLEYANLFCAGMLFYRIKQKGVSVVPVLLLFWCVLNTSFVPFRQFPSSPPPGWATPAVILICIVFWCAVSGYIPWIISTPTVFFGTISYTLYLVHNEIGRAVMDQMSERGYRPWTTFLVAFAFVLGLATLLTLVVERPALRWIRRRYAKWKDRHQTGIHSSHGGQ